MRKLKTSGKTGGFTLIELMIAIAIVGILLSLAVPAYQDYTVRAKIADALNVAASMKVLIGEYYITEAKLPKDAAAAGIDTALKSDYVSGIAYKAKPENSDNPTAGLIKLTLDSDIGGTAGGKVLQLKATLGANKKIVKWKCGPDEDADDEDAEDTNKLPSKYLPSQCR